VNKFSSTTSQNIDEDKKYYKKRLVISLTSIVLSSWELFV